MTVNDDNNNEETQNDVNGVEGKEQSPTFNTFSKTEENEDGESRSVEAVYKVPITISAVLGTSKMLVSDVLKLRRGAVVELDRRVGDAIDIFINNRLVARGEIIVVDEKLGVTMTEIIKLNKE